MKIWKILFLIFLAAGSILIISNEAPYQKNSGMIFGTYYNITYKNKDNLQGEIDACLRRVDKSLSPFNKTSVITKINNNEPTEPDSLFVQVFTLAQKISDDTDGAFDITVAPLVNAWGFGFKHGISTDSAAIDSMRRHIGYRTVAYDGRKIVKQHPETMLDCSAIAKGFGCDEVARLLDSRGIKDYMVEIGGEVVSKGKNEKSKPWTIGISKPVDDASGMSNELQEILYISNRSMATSGNYRNFRYDGNRKLAHTIDPRTGYPVAHSLLSATVVADDCATADAYATAFMVMGLEKSMEFCKARNNLDACFIYSDEAGNLQTACTEGMKRYMR